MIDRPQQTKLGVYTQNHLVINVIEMFHQLTSRPYLLKALLRF